MKFQSIALGLLTTLALATAGCDKFLDQPVLGQYEAGAFFTSNTNAVLAVNASRRVDASDHWRRALVVHRWRSR